MNGENIKTKIIFNVNEIPSTTIPVHIQQLKQQTNAYWYWSIAFIVELKQILMTKTANYLKN